MNRLIATLFAALLIFAPAGMAAAAPAATGKPAPATTTPGDKSAAKKAAATPAQGLDQGLEKKQNKKLVKKAKEKKKGKAPAIWMVIPFVVMLLCIAVLPLTFEHFWESNRNKLIISCLLGIPVAANVSTQPSKGRSEQ